MSFETSGIEQLRIKLQRLAGVSTVANEELKKCATEVRDLARKMAPLDKGNLEKAIKIRYEGTQGAGGRFVKGGGTYSIFIDGTMPVEGREGKTVGDYAWEQHEHLEPYGPWKLGPKSEQKQRENPSILVGGKFLERAIEELRAKINKRLAKVVYQYVTALDNDL